MPAPLSATLGVRAPMDAPWWANQMAAGSVSRSASRPWGLIASMFHALFNSGGSRRRTSAWRQRSGTCIQSVSIRKRRWAVMYWNVLARGPGPLERIMGGSGARFRRPHPPSHGARRGRMISASVAGRVLKKVRRLTKPLQAAASVVGASVGGC